LQWEIVLGKKLTEDGNAKQLNVPIGTKVEGVVSEKYHLPAITMNVNGMAKSLQVFMFAKPWMSTLMLTENVWDLKLNNKRNKEVHHSNAGKR